MRPAPSPLHSSHFRSPSVARMIRKWGSGFPSHYIRSTLRPEGFTKGRSPLPIVASDTSGEEVRWTSPNPSASFGSLCSLGAKGLSDEWGWKGSIVPHSPLPMWFTPFTPHDGPEGSEGPGSEWNRVNHMPLVSLSSHPFPFRSVSSATLGSLTSLMMRESDTVVPLGSLCSPFVTGGRLTQSIESFILGWAPSFPTSLTASGSFPTVFHLQH